jgi:chromate reductase, NAD(P)H dehydrogenase (quinone)
MPSDVQVLLVSGSLRSGSTNSALLRTAAAVAPEGITTAIHEGMGELPHFNPDDDQEGRPLHPAVAELRSALAGADAVLFCTPEYAGALPGSFKNLLDWTVGGGQTYEMPVGWVNVAFPPRGESAHESLRKVLGYTGSEIVEDAAVRITVERDRVGEDGMVTDSEIRAAVAAVLEALAAAARRRAERLATQS